MPKPRPRRARVALAVLAVLLTGSAASAYHYFRADELQRELDQQVGREVMVVDTLIKVWGYQDADGYLRFDTARFRCAIPTTKNDSIAYLRELSKKRAEGDRTPPLVAVFGKVTRAPIWGEVKGGESDGVVSEQVVLIVDRIEQPRGRFFDEDEGH